MVGVCGRTGAGKSTLISALFRTVEPSQGTILIDGIDIKTLGLQQLRQKLSIIPQDPVIFDNTLRNNLDPTGTSTDDEIWSYLEICNLKSNFVDSAHGLSTQVSEDSFSLGQKQLICLVRALLRKTKLLMLDEATASVDLETDRTIQQTIKDQFKNTTIITIAHRLQTIIDYDMIVVLSGGKIEECASPQELLSKKGTFYEMCKEAGLVE